MEQIKGFFYNHTSNSCKGKAKISFNLTPVVRAMGKLSEVQVYQRMYFEKCVKPKTDVEIVQKGIDNNHKLSYINLRAAEIYEGEDEDIRDIVRAEFEALEKEREDTEGLLQEIMSGKTQEYTPHEYVLMQTALPKIFKAVFEPLADKTGWTFAVLAGGPNPSLVNGECQTVSWYWEKTEDGDTFRDHDPCLKRKTLPPFGTFCHHLFLEEVCLQRAVTIDDDADPDALAKAGCLEGFMEYVGGCEVGKKAVDEDKDEGSKSDDHEDDVLEPPVKAKKTVKPHPVAKRKSKTNGSTKQSATSKAAKTGGTKKGGEGGTQKEVALGKSTSKAGSTSMEEPAGNGDLVEVETGVSSRMDGSQKESGAASITEYPFLVITPGSSDVVEEIAQLLKEGEEAVKQKEEAERRVEEEEKKRLDAVWGESTGRSARGDKTDGNSVNSTHQITLPPPLFLDDEDPNRQLHFDVPNEDEFTEEPIVFAPKTDHQSKHKTAEEDHAEGPDGERGRGKCLRKANSFPIGSSLGVIGCYLGLTTLWTECVQNWQSFKVMVMNPTGARIAAANYRPVEIWLTTRKFTSIPEVPIEGLPDYAHQWIVWWSRLQPAGRTGEESGVLPLKLESDHESVMVGTLKKLGEWGLYIIMVSLKMWVGLSKSDERWHNAVKDLNDCFKMLLGMSK